MADPNSTIPKRMKNRKRTLPVSSLLLSEANRIYAYDAINGGLTWKAHKNPNRPWPPIGNSVGGDDGHGYLMCLLLGHKFKVHQIVWLLHHGSLPAFPIDHANRNKKDNRIANLRLATDSQNIHNQKDYSKGFSKDTRGNGFVARIDIGNGKKKYLGYFKTEDEAHNAYVKAKRELHGDFSSI